MELDPAYCEHGTGFLVPSWSLCSHTCLVGTIAIVSHCRYCQVTLFSSISIPNRPKVESPLIKSSLRLSKCSTEKRYILAHSYLNTVNNSFAVYPFSRVKPIQERVYSIILLGVASTPYTGPLQRHREGCSLEPVYCKSTNFHMRLIFVNWCHQNWN